MKVIIYEKEEEEEEVCACSVVRVGTYPLLSRSGEGGGAYLTRAHTHDVEGNDWWKQE